MTTIVYRAGVLAADTRAYSGSSRPIGQKRKIGAAIFSDGVTHYYGISTPHPGLAEEIRNWMVHEKDAHFEPSAREFEMLEITSEGEVFFYLNSLIPAGPITADYYAIGSGAEYALGALRMGASALEAVEVAAENDPYTGHPLMTVTIPELTPTEPVEN